MSIVEKIKNIDLKKALKELVIFFALLFIATNVVSFFRAPKIENNALLTMNTTTIDGTHLDSLHVNHEKPLLIHFWATWCPTCKMENSTINALSKKFDVITIAVNSGSDQEIKEFLHENNLDFKVINDANDSIAQKFQVSGFPTTFIYRKDGKLEFSEMGYSSYFTLYLKLLYAGR